MNIERREIRSRALENFTLAKSQAAVAPTFPSYREADMRPL